MSLKIEPYSAFNLSSKPSTAFLPPSKPNVCLISRLIDASIVSFVGARKGRSANSSPVVSSSIAMLRRQRRQSTMKSRQIHDFCTQMMSFFALARPMSLSLHTGSGSGYVLGRSALARIRLRSYASLPSHIETDRQSPDLSSLHANFGNSV